MEACNSLFFWNYQNDLGQGSGIGICEWEDCADRKLFIPTTMRGQIVLHGIHRKLKPISVVVCISDADDHLTPCFVSFQTNSTVERTLRIDGFRTGIDLILRQRSKASMNSELFNEYFSAVLLPYINALRSKPEFRDKDTVLLMDNCSVHVRSGTLQMLVNHHVKVW
jgi:hypothetical protein